MELSKTGVYRAQMSYHRVVGTRRGTKEGEAMWHKAKKRSDEFLDGVSPRQRSHLSFVSERHIPFTLQGSNLFLSGLGDPSPNGQGFFESVDIQTAAENLWSNHPAPDIF